MLFVATACTLSGDDDDDSEGSVLVFNGEASRALKITGIVAEGFALSNTSVSLRSATGEDLGTTITAEDGSYEFEADASVTFPLLIATTANSLGESLSTAVFEDSDGDKDGEVNALVNPITTLVSSSEFSETNSRLAKSIEEKLVRLFKHDSIRFYE